MGSTGAALIVWVAAGALAWTGASSFAELGAAIPLNGGAQAYLNHSFGPWASYLFVWTSLVALKVNPRLHPASRFKQPVQMMRPAFHTLGALMGISFLLFPFFFS